MKAPFQFLGVITLNARKTLFCINLDNIFSMLMKDAVFNRFYRYLESFLGYRKNSESGASVFMESECEYFKADRSVVLIL